VADFDLQHLFSSGTSSVPSLQTLIVRMRCACLIGAVVASRFWRRLLKNTLGPQPQNVQAQTLMAAAGAVLVVVLGDHPARAFGLVGLGSFVRFRAGLSDPRDAVVTFVMIGLGMACGLGLLGVATLAALLVALLLLLFDLREPSALRRVLVTINGADTQAIVRYLPQLFPSCRVLEAADNAVELGKDSGRIVAELELRGDLDASGLRARREAASVPGVRRVAFVID
jgi:hypothetical protein